MYTLDYTTNELHKNEMPIPIDGDNPDYLEYSKWLAAGNGPTIIRSELPLPSIEVSPWQIRKALNITGMRQVIEDFIASSDNIDLQDGWKYATSFNSDDPFVLYASKALNKPLSEMYSLFQLALGL